MKVGSVTIRREQGWEHPWAVYIQMPDHQELVGNYDNRADARMYRGMVRQIIAEKPDAESLDALVPKLPDYRGRRQKIVTALNFDSGIPVAYTKAEWENLSQNERDFAAYDEYVWQYQPNKEAAIARHEKAHDRWRAEINAGKPERDTY